MQLAELTEIQRQLARLVSLRDALEGPPELVGGADASYRGATVRAAIVVVAIGDMRPVDSVVWEGKVIFPYVPGFLSFRELPGLLGAWEGLRVLPDVLLVDGQGILHPRGLGLASHLGVVLGWPTVGCAKSRLVGQGPEPGPRKGDVSPLRVFGQLRGFAVRARERVKPVYVSPGHLVSPAGAVDVCLRCLRRFRIPEPLRLAHRLASQK